MRAFSMRNRNVPTFDFDRVVCGLALHRHYRNDILILVLHFDPETVDAGTGLVAVLDIDYEIVVAHRFEPARLLETWARPVSPGKVAALPDRSDTNRILRLLFLSGLSSAE